MLALGVPAPSEWALILVIVLVLFGAKKLPELARSLGQSNQCSDENPLDHRESGFSEFKRFHDKVNAGHGSNPAHADAEPKGRSYPIAAVWDRPPYPSRSRTLYLSAHGGFNPGGPPR
jgi:TatA/E family protein of Tat protein translocase